MTNKAKAQIAYDKKLAEITRLIGKIQSGTGSHVSSPSEITWAHVGDLGAVEEYLKNASDFINQEGEYAE